jgi:hypothetical protein
VINLVVLIQLNILNIMQSTENKITVEWLSESLSSHNLWLDSRFDENPQGKRFTVPSGANLSGANLSDVNLSDANLSGANLSDVNLSDANLRYANLSDANLSDANLRCADLSDADLRCADLRCADLSDADLSDADLRCADLSDADLSCADLSCADLSDADLSCADLSCADLSCAIGNAREIISMQSVRYKITYTAQVIQIGCKKYSHEEWWAFSDDEISAMDNGALEWWATHKPLLRAWIAANPATKTNHKIDE